MPTLIDTQTRKLRTQLLCSVACRKTGELAP
jgi:hypothetical protein